MRKVIELKTAIGPIGAVLAMDIRGVFKTSSGLEVLISHDRSFKGIISPTYEVILEAMADPTTTKEKTTND